MGVTIEGRYMSPYWRQNAVAVTSSQLKINLYREAKIPTEADPQKVNSVGNGESHHDSLNGHGVVVRTRVVDVPYPVLVADAKGRELARSFHPNGHQHVVADSTWEIIGPDQQHVYSLNKPQAKRKREEEVVDVLRGLQGCRISSDTGVCVLSPDLRSRELYHLSLMIGIVNPRLDMGVLEELIKTNPAVAGGLSLHNAISAGIIIPDPFAHFRIRKINRHGAPDEKGTLMRFEAIQQELSTGSENAASLLSLALGIPKDRP